jgi:hypothetical protein
MYKEDAIMAKNGKKKKQQMINDLYNEITRLKAENEQLRKGYNSAADTSTVDDAEFKESKDKVKLNEDDEKIVKFASKFAKLLGLDNNDLDDMRKELSETDDAERKKEFMDKLERKVVELDSSERLAKIEAMELAGEDPLKILKATVPGYQDIDKENDKIVERLMAKMRQEAFGEPTGVSFGGLRL